MNTQTAVRVCPMAASVETALDTDCREPLAVFAELHVHSPAAARWAVQREFRISARQAGHHARIKALGAFFTPSWLADLLLAPIAGKLGVRANVIDPACGSGELLLAAHRLFRTIPGTKLSLRGIEIERQFASVAKSRISQAVEEQWQIPAPEICIQIGDGQTAEPYFLDDLDLVVMNPPFVAAVAPKSCQWTSGRVSSAALFLASWVERIPNGTRIAAILPDVLRTGSRYAKLRAQLEACLCELDIQLLGEYPGAPDVDVFILRGKKGPLDSRLSVAWTPGAAADSEHPTVGGIARVSVGAVVPHRDATIGLPVYPFICAGNCPKLGTIDVAEIAATRATDKRVFTAPFLVLRRTSSPRDSNRLVWTIVVGRGQVAVENHLLVVAPSDGSVATCLLLAEAMTQPEAQRWIGFRMRCRHLTVSSVRELPIVANKRS